MPLFDSYNGADCVSDVTRKGVRRRGFISLCHVIHARQLGMRDEDPLAENCHYGDWKQKVDLLSPVATLTSFRSMNFVKGHDRG